MEFNIYNKYKVKVINNYSYQDPETSTPGDISFSEGCDESERIDEGGDFASALACCLLDKDFSGITFGDNKIIIEFFDPTSGESGTLTYILETV